MMKNEHIVWAYGKDDAGREVVMIGLTTTGLDYLRAGPCCRSAPLARSRTSWSGVARSLRWSRK